MSVSSGDFLSIQPTELQFPFELRKPGGAYLYLTNKTDETVAFKVKTTNTMLFFSNPSRGIVSPGTTFRLIVVADAQKEAPKDMLCNDMFLVQSFIAPKGATENDITPQMFDDESGNVVKEFMFGGIYVPVNPSVPERIEESYLLDVITNDAQRNPHPGLRRRHIHEVQQI